LRHSVHRSSIFLVTDKLRPNTSLPVLKYNHIQSNSLFGPVTAVVVIIIITITPIIKMQQTFAEKRLSIYNNSKHRINNRCIFDMQTL